MSETDEIVLDSTRRLFENLFPHDEANRRDESVWPQPAWDKVAELGLPLALLPEEAGGFGLGAGAIQGIVGLAGRYAVPLPIAESMIATRLLGEAAIEAPDGALTIAAAGPSLKIDRSGEGLALSGTLPRVPWGADAAGIVFVADLAAEPVLALLLPQDVSVRRGRNMAGEPRDEVTVETTVPPERVRPSPVSRAELKAQGAAMRAMQLAGCLGRVLDMSVAYANERVQFGRPIGKFQAIQQNLAVMAGQAAASEGAAALAAAALLGEADPLVIAAAKVRTGEAAGIVASIAHQVHGAIGFTEEHTLHVATRRLWSWRDEYGGEAEWSRLIGDRVAKAGADGLWPLVASL